MTKLPNNQTLIKSLESLFVCKKNGKFTEMFTPFLYPDGDGISLLFSCQDDNVIVTDCGETVRWLMTCFPMEEISKRQTSKIRNICAHLDVEFYNGELRIVLDGDDISDAAMRVAQAALRVSGINSFNKSPVPVEKMQDKVSELFMKHKLKYQRNWTETGLSGKGWKVDFRLQERNLVNVMPLKQGTEVARTVEHIFTSFSDLSSSHPKDRLFTIMSENYGIDSADKKLLEKVSIVIPTQSVVKRFAA